MNIQPITKYMVIDRIVRGIGVERFNNEITRLVVILAEYLRKSLFELSLEAGGNKEFKPVHIHKLGHFVGRYLSPIWNDLSFIPTSNTKSESREVNLVTWTMKRLSILGDCIHLGGGFWLPTPIRLVRLKFSDDIAIIGGLSTAQLRQFTEVSSTGVGRLLVNAEHSIPGSTNDVDSNFLGWVPQNVESWIEDLVSKSYKQGIESSSTFADYEVYTSIAQLRYTTKRTWIPGQLLLEGHKCENVMLCRMGKPFRYFIGQFLDGKLNREYPLSNEIDHRWLQLGFCHLHGLPRTATYRKNNLLRMFPAIPRVLERILEVYSIPIPTGQHTTDYYVPERYIETINKFISMHGYTVRSSRGGDKDERDQN
ncbi:hypothetical protein [Alicyclobacillus mengziensis]|uniref:Uncharacterized protein n=1 Tax=Alicyclobacillus mengziensis TaxID=2931921 RepID=A0A9X7VX39_9BACL|nr:MULTISPECIES: hypothetical protein [Alicyclobacillus]MCF8568211.1 hypothetical protein [Alicyclobacillus tolerans]QSO46676.1 hypothetical protein JZ786_19880 [Alicyclobacillus mengziensis]